MNEDTDYIIISLMNYVKVMHSVRSYIKDGWEPLGGISVSYINSGEYMYAQAMIKTIKQPSNL